MAHGPRRSSLCPRWRKALEPAPYGPLPAGSGRQTWARRPADEAEAKALASPLRLRILRIALHEPRTNKEIAEALGRNPASVLHHVRTLVDTGFLIEQPRRRGQRGSRELPYLASGKSFYLEMGEAMQYGDQNLLAGDLPGGGSRPSAGRCSTATGSGSGSRTRTG